MLRDMGDIINVDKREEKLGGVGRSCEKCWEVLGGVVRSCEKCWEVLESY